MCCLGLHNCHSIDQFIHLHNHKALWLRFEATFGRSSPNTLKARAGYAKTLMGLGEAGAAEVEMEAVLQGRIIQLGYSHLETCRTAVHE